MSRCQNYFVASDHHFGHKNIIQYCRPQFTDLDEMHDHIITQHNKVVGKQDKVFFLGDVAFGSDNLKFLELMNGVKYLVMGNHDVHSTYEYLKYFNKVFGVAELKPADDCSLILTHVPVAEDQMVKRFGLNIHGHLHQHVIELNGINDGKPDPRYVNVTMEHINFTPRQIGDIVAAYI